MSDERLRQLERAFRAEPTEENRLALERERERRFEPCPGGRHVGPWEPSHELDCRMCSGGKVRYERRRGYPCRGCDGAGRVGSTRCLGCGTLFPVHLQLKVPDLPPGELEILAAGGYQ